MSRDLPVVEAAGATRLYRTADGAVTGVRHASLSVAAGEIVGITGASGAGKSVLLRLLSGIERPTGGLVSYQRAPAWDPRRKRQRRASYPRPGYAMPIFQDPFASLDGRWPIWRTITEPLAVHGVPLSRDRRVDIARGLLDRSHMANVDAMARPAELSGGQCQRVAILRAVVAEPTLIVADEPTARQDVITATAMTQMLREAMGPGTSAVVVSHDLTWLRTFADRILRLVDGRLAIASDG